MEILQTRHAEKFQVKSIENVTIDRLAVDTRATVSVLA